MQKYNIKVILFVKWEETKTIKRTVLVTDFDWNARMQKRRSQ